MLKKEYLTRILAARVYDLAEQTPLTELANVSTETGAHVLLKREDLQPIFSFKIRGAANKVAQMPDEDRKRGVITSSAGNHAQGLAMTAKAYGIPATIVMSQSTPSIKIKAVEGLGAKVVLHGDTLEDAYDCAMDISAETGMTFVHPFDDADVIAGQGTVGMEVLQQCKQRPYAVFVPIGGGGLIAGMGAYIKSVAPDVKIIGVEPEGAAGMHASFAAGHPVTLNKIDRFADGVAVRAIGKLSYELAKECVDDIILVSTDEICAAVRDIFEGARAIMEPSGALALAGLKRYARKNDVKGQELVAIASGANVNFDRFGTIVERAELGSGGEALLAVTIPEKPGSFLKFCKLIGRRNITEFNYRYSCDNSAQVLAGIRLTGGKGEREELVKSIADEGLPVSDLTRNEVAKRHVRHMIGGPVKTPEREVVYRFEFPERPGALVDFLSSLAGRWSISMFHYRNHGSAYGQVLLGMQVPEKDGAEFEKFLTSTGFEFREETGNPAYQAFLVDTD
ncbi:MAG: threonine ammonia-lyase, biosynthetic [Alphaproteobacteria bacterium]|nr:threonine ammonia-lyase, biosynthetic [Alphaproteobacteria bacterium]